MNYGSEFETHGFTILPSWMPEHEMSKARTELDDIYPCACHFHSNPDGKENARFLDDEFGGINTFPFAGTELCLLAVHSRLVHLAEELLGSTDIRLYTAELWAKYTGAADYDQPFHRDFLNHTLLVPRPDRPQDQIEIFLFLDDVEESQGPPHFVSKQLTGYEPPFPNWQSRKHRPEWYAAEVSAAGPAGTVAAYGIDTFHRGTNLVKENGARYTMQVGFRRAATEWASRLGWANYSHEKVWYEFVSRASLRQLLLFGFPPPGHEYWDQETLKYAGMRYPGLDISRFHIEDS